MFHPTEIDSETSLQQLEIDSEIEASWWSRVRTGAKDNSFILSRVLVILVFRRRSLSDCPSVYGDYVRFWH